MPPEPFLLDLRYHAWATRRALDAAAALGPDELTRNLPSSYPSVRETLVHIYQADTVWFDRLNGVSTGPLTKYEGDPDFQVFAAKWLGLLDEYKTWAQGLSAEDWDRVVDFRNLKGDAYRLPVWKIVQHVVNHASYHRGQVAMMFRQLGHTPTGTDMSTFHYQSV
ncbi:MAG: DinB family protein [Bryobacteraceae bacterium]